MEKDPSKRTNRPGSLTVELLERMEKLEAENKELKEKMKLKLYEESVKSSKQMDIIQVVTAVFDLKQSLEAAVGKVSSDIKKMVADSVFEKYEEQAIAIEKEAETENSRQLQREREMKAEAVAANRHLAVSTAVNALRNNFNKITLKIEQMEQEQNNILRQLAPLEDEVRFISKQLDTNTLLILGMKNPRGEYNRMLVLGPGRWIRLSLKLPKGLDSGGAVYVEGELYIFGGMSMGKATYKLEKETLEWERMADMNESRYYITKSCLEWNGSIWVFGGWNGGRYLKSVERYDLKENKWTSIRNMRHSRSEAAAVVSNDKFIVCGGWNGVYYMESVECFDPESGVWTVLDDLPVALGRHSTVTWGNILIAMGDYDGSPILNQAVEMINMEERTGWIELPSMNCPRSGSSVVVINNQMFVIGGKRRREVEIFDGESWRNGPVLPYACSEMCTIVIPQHFSDILCNYKLS